MGKIRPLYRENSMSDFLYDNVRSGASHFSMYKKYASCSSDSKIYPTDKHLFLTIRANNDVRIIIQVFQLIDDFIEAYYLFKENYIKIHYKDAYNKLNSMLKSGKNFEKLISSLKQKNKIFYPKAESMISTSNADSSSPSLTYGSSASPSEAYFDNY